MTTEKFTTAAETFTKNVNDTMKWLQETTATILETQSKQIKSASEIYNKAVTASWENINTNNFNSFWMPGTVFEIMQKNIETISNLSKASMKSAWEFGKQTETNSSKEAITKIVDAYKKQVEEIAVFNQQSFETLNKQFADTTTWTPWAEKFKKEFETSVETSKVKVKEIVDAYNKIATPSVESNKELFNNLNKQITASVNENLKQWSEFTNAYTTKFADVKNPVDFFKATTAETTTTTATKKKTANAVANN
jgi:hypothetical protein